MRNEAIKRPLAIVRPRPSAYLVCLISERSRYIIWYANIHLICSVIISLNKCSQYTHMLIYIRFSWAPMTNVQAFLGAWSHELCVCERKKLIFIKMKHYCHVILLLESTIKLFSFIRWRRVFMWKDITYLRYWRRIKHKTNTQFASWRNFAITNVKLLLTSEWALTVCSLLALCRQSFNNSQRSCQCIKSNIVYRDLIRLPRYVSSC